MCDSQNSVSSAVIYISGRTQHFLLLSSLCFLPLPSTHSELWPSPTVTAHRWLWQSLTDGPICGTTPISATQMVQSTSNVSNRGAATKPHHNFLPGWHWYVAGNQRRGVADAERRITRKTEGRAAAGLNREELRKTSERCGCV